MHIKTRLKSSSCSLGEWGAELSKKDLREVREFLGTIKGNRITGAQNQKLTDLWNHASGRQRKPTNCNSCVRGMIKELNTLIKEA